MRHLSLLLLLIATSAFAASPSTINNDDSCDVTVGPAATLLLPHFEVDYVNRTQDTLFTITNVSRFPQVAHVTIWTDWSFPVFAFNIYLTGYDVQSISLNQILSTGIVAQNAGTGPTVVQTQLSGVGALSAGFTANPNFAGGGASINCASQPGQLNPVLVFALRTALTSGVYSPSGSASCGASVGGNHPNGNAVGYLTIDVVASCTNRLPTDPLYYTNDLLFDNVLIGDYQQLGPASAGTHAQSFDAGSNSLVHIRAVPEGGGAGSKVATALPYTFYDRYTPASARSIDRRQPLPSTFAARFVQGGPNAFSTNLNIWREGFGNGTCSDARSSSTMGVAEIVRFDEHENPSTLTNDPLRSARLPATSATSSADPSYPAMLGSDTGGWLYLNLNNGGSTTYSARDGVSTNATFNMAPAGATTTVGPRPSQNWVTMTLFSRSSEGSIFAAELDAASLGNGCTPATFPTSAVPIGPAGGVFECPPGTTLTDGSIALCTQTAQAIPVAPVDRRRAVGRTATLSSIANDDSCDIKVGPAATLLLPYFEVDVSGKTGQTTFFTVTNVSRYPQIAHVTLWTDYAYPVLTFNLFLGAYDVQAINLADVLIRNTVAPPNGTTPGTTPASIWPSSNPNLRPTIDCTGIPGVVPANIMALVRTALTTGAAAPSASCSHLVGSVHANAIGYATVDVVASCTTRTPSDPLYYANDLLFDNVLIGDYQQIGATVQLDPYSYAPTTAYVFDAAGNPMVHIRALPEGGGAGSNVNTRLPYTFYDRYTPAAARTMDRRQPLPSTFAAHYIQGGPGNFMTNVAIWREGFGAGGCADAFVSASMPVSEIVRFDEHENPSFIFRCFPECHTPPAMLNAASSTYFGGQWPSFSSDVGGWMYLNLNNGGSTSYSVTRNAGTVAAPTNTSTNLAPARSTTITGPRASQNWVTVTLLGTWAGGNRLTGAFDAAPLGNGCMPAAFIAADNLAVPGASPSDFRPIAPGGGLFVCPPGTTLTDGTTTQCQGTNVNPTP